MGCGFTFSSPTTKDALRMNTPRVGSISVHLSTFVAPNAKINSTYLSRQFCYPSSWTEWCAIPIVYSGISVSSCSGVMTITFTHSSLWLPTEFYRASTTVTVFYTKCKPSVIVNWTSLLSFPSCQVMYYTHITDGECYFASISALVRHNRLELFTPWLKVKCSINWANVSWWPWLWAFHPLAGLVTVCSVQPNILQLLLMGKSCLPKFRSLTTNLTEFVSTDYWYTVSPLCSHW